MLEIWTLRLSCSSKIESRFSSRGVGAAGTTSTAGRLRTMNLGTTEEHAIIMAVANAKGEIIDDCGACVRTCLLVLAAAARLLYRSNNEFINLQSGNVGVITN